MKQLFSILFIISLSSSFAQVTSSKLDSNICARVKYDSSLAKEDLVSGKVRIIVPLTPDYLFDLALSSEELNSIEGKFGFRYEYIEFKLLRKFVLPRINEYNSEVYSYLDSVHQVDVKEEIDKEIKKVFNSKFRKK